MKKEREFGDTFLGKCWQGIKDYIYGARVDLHEILPHKEKEDRFSDETIRKQKRARYVKNSIGCYVIMFLPIIDLLIFWAWGSIQSWPIAFETYDINDHFIGYSLNNFKFIFDSFKVNGEIFPEALGNTVKYWGWSFFVLQPLSFMLSFFLYKKVFFYRGFRYIFFFPHLLSSVIICAFFKYLVGPGGQVQHIAYKFFGIGTLNERTGVIDDGLLLLAESKYAFKTMIFYNSYVGLTGNMIYWLAAFARIPYEIVEAGMIDGLTTMKEFRYITFPCVWGFVATMLMLAVTGIFSGGGPALLLTQGKYGTYDLGYYVYTLTVGGAKQAQAQGGAIGLLQSVILLPLTLFINSKVKKIETIEF